MQKDNSILHYETNNNERNKMINNPKESDFQLKQEAQSTNHEKPKASSTNSSSSQWLKLKDPRIVRVSRAFGGKDRHSKVFTIRGLRDRRVRLSVPTAIHLYDLQDRLGLNQPSKVVDWLLNVAKDEIDELPPLPIAPENFPLGYPSLSINNTNDANQNNTSIWESKSKQGLGEMVSISEEEYKQVAKRCCQKFTGNSAGSCRNSSSEHVLPNSVLPIGLLNTMPLGYQLEHFSGDVSQFANFGFVNQIGDIQHGINVVPFPSSSLSLSTGNSSTNASSQILVCPSGVTQPYFPSHVATMEMDTRQINQYHQLVMSSSNQSNSLNILPQHLMRMSTPKLFHSPNNGESHSHRDQDFPSK